MLEKGDDGCIRITSFARHIAQDTIQTPKLVTDTPKIRGHFCRNAAPDGLKAKCSSVSIKVMPARAVSQGLVDTTPCRLPRRPVRGCRAHNLRGLVELPCSSVPKTRGQNPGTKPGDMA